MKLACVALIAACVVGGFAQAQERGREDKAVARACKAEAEHMCAGKSGHDLTQCLQRNREKLSSNCQDALPKLPQPKS